MVSSVAELGSKVEKLMQHTKNLEKELEQLKSKLAANASGDLIGSARTSPKGIKVITETVKDTDTDTLRSMVDTLRVKLGSGVVALGAQQGGKAVIVAGVTSDLTPEVNAGKLVKEASVCGGGKGGGRADFAQAGGVDPALLEQALERLFELVA